MNDPAVPTAVDAIARTCLYEGYLLWPYRRSALKNAKRWTFGGIFPRGDCAETLGERDGVTAQVLLEHVRPPYEVTVRLRFLHVVDRTVWREGPEGPERADALTVAGERHVTWQEATEREVLLALSVPGDGPRTTSFDIPEGSDTEPLADARGRRAGSVVHSWRRLTGTLTADSEPLAPGVDRLTVRVVNTSDCPPPRPGDRHARERAAGSAFASTHLILHSDQGRFVSQLDPPEELRQAAAACANDGVWPVLAGEPGGADGRRAHTVLASPITLYDFPAVAPESPGDLFDGTEIDQLLVLSVLSMTEEEQAEARACDPRAREILDRCAGLGLDELARLHGAIREFRPAAPQPREDA
ncbi:hypothetical protein QCN29_18975 [Streptomyces sp. HNM0663]|uniref:Hydrogenase maturation protease n=1 Tax=Streptomyces chengmaiensis TaxID=3040919 RepID=A0ABT6HQ40_9ACTN|nr:hypothetical protein [Streptomyces chengmaiensis]MDH2390837.1 hypothetical protein [Streptomyces chengmaiensis]